MTKKTKAFAAAIALAALASPAAAHRLGVPVTTIEYNDRTELWEVVHRISAHDLEAVMVDLVPLDGLYDTRDGVLAIGRYVDAHFTIFGPEGEAALTYLGAELDRDMVFVYFEAADLTPRRVDSDLLLVDDPRAHALVNIATPNGLETLVFVAADGPKAIPD